MGWRGRCDTAALMVVSAGNEVSMFVLHQALMVNHCPPLLFSYLSHEKAGSAIHFLCSGLLGLDDGLFVCYLPAMLRMKCPL